MYDANLNHSIHGLPDYIDYEFTIHFTLVFSLVPCFYIIPTIIIMWKVFRGYQEMNLSMTKRTLDENIFTLLIAYFVLNILFFFADYCRFNIPSTGRITAWCALQEPGFHFTMISVLADWLNYCIILLPFLVSFIRVAIIVYFDRHGVSANVMSNFVLPVLLIVPVLCVTSMIPATGYCRQLGPPFPFGAIQFYYTGPLFNLRRAYFILSLSMACCLLSTVISFVMCWKIRERLHQNMSNYTRRLTKKAETSLTVTLVSAVVPFATNTIVSVAAIWFPDVVFYLVYLRQIGNDFETVMMPWTLYLTHPVFCERREVKRKKREGAVEAWRTSTVSFT